jgi:methylenetetrahydrofolate reductase (NADPH)
MQAARDLGLTDRCAILAGVGPIRSRRALERMGQIPGIVIPPEVRSRLLGVPEERFLAESITICAEIVRAVREIPGVRGVHIMAFGLEEAVAEIAERAGLGRRGRTVHAG